MIPELHKPVLLEEVLAGLKCGPGGVYADGTIGMGGHAAAILMASAPTGWLYGSDRDGDALEIARARLAPFAGRFALSRGNFSELDEWVPQGSCDGVLLDLGVNSAQLERAERGFSFQKDGPLDMRMDNRQTVTAALLLNEASEAELVHIFADGGEPRAAKLVRAVVRSRAARPFTSTLQFAGLVERILPRHGKKRHPATRAFQALRLAVNAELPSLRRGLEAAVALLKPGGRLAVITFHSGEDKIVKAFGRELALDYFSPGGADIPELRQPRTPVLRPVQRKAIQPSAREIEENPRARSAQLRVFEKA